MKSTVGTAAEVMSGQREDPIVNVAEEGKYRMRACLGRFVK
jgi:hypothetical protein